MYGLELSTNIGVLAISSRFSNYAYYGKYSASTSTTITIYNSTLPPLVFLRTYDSISDTTIHSIYTIGKATSPPVLTKISANSWSFILSNSEAYVFASPQVSGTNGIQLLGDTDFSICDNNPLIVKDHFHVSCGGTNESTTNPFFVSVNYRSAAIIGSGIAAGHFVWQFNGVRYTNTAQGTYVLASTFRMYRSTVAGTDVYNTLGRYSNTSLPVQTNPGSIMLIDTTLYP